MLGFAANDRLLVHRLKDSKEAIGIVGCEVEQPAEDIRRTTHRPGASTCREPRRHYAGHPSRDTDKAGDPQMSIYIYDLATAKSATIAGGGPYAIE